VTRFLSPRALLPFALAALFAPEGAEAHPQSLSYADLRVRGAQVEARLRFAAADLLPLLKLDADGDGQINARDLELLGPALPAAVFRELRLRSGGEACAAVPARAELEPPDGVLLEGSFRCPGEIEDLEVRAGFLELLAAGHTLLAKISFEEEGSVAQRIAAQGTETFSVSRQRSSGRNALRFLLLGVEHIFTGFDHIAFLLGLLLLGGSFPTLLKIVTSFTVAHSITLALAALDIVAPPPRLVEPLIAASIVFVALENLWALRSTGEDREAAARRALGHRWMITFAFGLVHGFGFAAALRGLHLPRAGLAASLLTFNLGVEVGQVAIVAAALPLLALLRRQRWFLPRGVRALSAAVGAAGLFWLVQRVAGL
jgi:uncharacterized membrane protein